MKHTIYASLQTAVSNETLRQNLLALREQIQDAESLDIFQEELALNDHLLVACTQNEDPKIRRLACQLLAKTENDQYYPLLRDTYLHETQLFVRPGMLKCLESFDLTEDLTTLEQREKEMTTLLAGENAKHYTQELRILRQLLKPYRQLACHTFTGLIKEVPVVLSTYQGHQERLMDEMTGYETKKVALGVQVRTQDVEALFAYRLFNALYFPVLKLPDFKLTTLVDGLSKPLILSFLDSCHQGEKSYRFRLHAHDHEQLREVAEKLEIASQGRLVNQPSDYEIEFYLHENKQGACVVYLRLMTIKDPRFTYRKAVSSSSLAPETAALINSYVLDYASLKGEILDPVCNDGVLLIERAMVDTPRFMLGLAKSEDILNKARYNADQAHAPVQFVGRPLATFTHRRSFDEILSALPTGTSQQDLEETREIYVTLFRRMPDFLKVGGKAFLYTTEHRWMKELLDDHAASCQLVKRIRIIHSKIRSGYLYIIERKA